jgi:hypothetical protein
MGIAAPDFFIKATQVINSIQVTNSIFFFFNNLSTFLIKSPSFYLFIFDTDDKLIYLYF